ncbi:MAG TPA: FHA domain-containing protein [Pyrinomonadaceae bacterium]|nr:FHA domain-containing protein [Pyrinomonadaceae bacterium]
MAGTFIIVREDLQLDPARIVAEGLLLGRLPTCEVLLNHPSVSRLHAGISFTDDNYYIRGLRQGNPVLLNGTALTDYEALAPGDVLGIGPFTLDIDFDQQGLLIITVSLQIAATPADSVRPRELSGVYQLPSTGGFETSSEAALQNTFQPGREAKPTVTSSRTLDVFWDKRITAATKAVRSSPLFPRTGKRAGKAQLIWSATTDLKRRWAGSMLLWGAIPVGLLAAAGAWFYAPAFAPGSIAEVHTRTTMNLSPPIAESVSAGKCTSCHTLGASMASRCSSCHTTEAFAATVIAPHTNAGIGCADCHAEHRGAGFNPIDGALLSCFQCHNDQNKQKYNGKTVATPHGGTLGYPVVNGHWQWAGLDADEMAARKTTLQLERLPSDSDDQWRSKQFHAVHLYRVRAVASLPGNREGQLSCSSCHATRDPIDLTTPRTTCGKCHNGQTDARAGRQVIAADKPNCTSCHVQHNKDKRHWNPSLLSQNRSQ